MSVTARLLHAPDLCTLDPSLVAALAACGEATRVPANAPLLSEGRANDLCYLNVEGEVELYLERPGRSLRVRRVERGEFFGHDALLERAPQRWSARALSPATLLRFDHATLLHTLRRDDALSVLLHERMVVSSVRQLRGATALLLSAPAPDDPATPEDPHDLVSAIAARMGVHPDALEDVRAETDLPASWKRPTR